MKIIIGIILVVLLIGALTLYLILMLNAHELIYCGDVVNENDNSASVTRVYTTDFSANETLSEIVTAVNTADGETVTVTEITEILAEYQSIIYAPVFLVNSEQIDTSTFEITGSVYNGIDDKGNPKHNDYIYKNMRLNVVVQNGEVLAVQNIYPEEDTKKSSKERETLVERQRTIDPIIINENSTGVFALEDCDSFRLLFKGTSDFPATVTLVYTYDVVAENPLDFTNIEDGALGMTMNVGFDEKGFYDPSYGIAKNVIVEKKKN